MRTFLAFATLGLASASKVPMSKVLTLRGGMDLGPIDSGSVNSALKVCNARALASMFLDCTWLSLLGGGRDSGRAAHAKLLMTPHTNPPNHCRLQVAAAVTAAGAITEKYADIGETTLTKLFKGDVWSTNLIIAIVTGVATNVLYSVGASDFDSGKLTSALWLLSVLVKLKDGGFDVAGLVNDPVEPVIALLLALFAWM